MPANAPWSRGVVAAATRHVTRLLALTSATIVCTAAAARCDFADGDGNETRNVKEVRSCLLRNKDAIASTGSRRHARIGPIPRGAKHVLEVLIPLASVRVGIDATLVFFESQSAAARFEVEIKERVRVVERRVDDVVTRNGTIVVVYSSGPATPSEKRRVNACLTQ